jgi:hypothetical protein
MDHFPLIHHQRAGGGIDFPGSIMVDGPAPLRTYIHDLETRADPARDVQELALARMTIAALQQRIRELEP